MSIISNLGRRAVPLLLLALAGCGDPNNPVDNLPRKAVSGSVTLDGQPIVSGKIQFEPASDSKTPMAPVVGEIKDGKYEIEQKLGPVPGKYTVVVSSIPPLKIDPTQPPGPMPPPEPEKVPPQFNIRTTLTKEIPDESAVTADFALLSSAPDTRAAEAAPAAGPRGGRMGRPGR